MRGHPDVVSLNEEGSFGLLAFLISIVEEEPSADNTPSLLPLRPKEAMIFAFLLQVSLFDDVIQLLSPSDDVVYSLLLII